MHRITAAATIVKLAATIFAKLITTVVETFTPLVNPVATLIQPLATIIEPVLLPRRPSAHIAFHSSAYISPSSIRIGASAYVRSSTPANVTAANICSNIGLSANVGSGACTWLTAPCAR